MKRALTHVTALSTLTLFLSMPYAALPQRSSAKSYSSARLNSIRTVNVKGVIELQGLVHSAPKQSVTISVSLPDRTYIAQAEVKKNDKCHFRIPEGVHLVTIKGAKWLSRKVMIDTSTQGNVCDILLLGGDADGDNYVDWPDMDILADAYQSQKGDPGYDERADFDCDGDVDDTDADILFYNLFQYGE